MLTEEQTKQIGTAKCFMKGIRKAILEKNEMSRNENKNEMMNMRIHAINEVVNDFNAILYVFEKKERDILVRYINSRNYKEFIDQLKNMDVSEKDYQKSISNITLRLYELLPKEKNVANIVAQKMSILLKK